MNARRFVAAGAFALGLVLASSPARIAAENPDRAVYRVRVDVDALDQLRRTIDVWAFLPADRDVPPARGEAIVLLDTEELETLRAAGLEPEIDRQRTDLHLAPRPARKGVVGAIPNYPCYRTVEQTHADLAAAAAARPEIAEWLDLGDSWEKENLDAGYDLPALVLTNEAIPGPKPKLVILAAQHAREYATAEIATRFLLELVEGYSVDPEITWLLDHREIHGIAQANPDGRKRAEAGSFWRKNANNDFCADTGARGVDTNRNASFLWGGSGSSNNGCSEIFRGPSAASEPETIAVEDYLATIFPDRKGDLDSPAPADTEGLFLSLHSFGELVLYPWEAMPQSSPNHAALRTLGRKLAHRADYTACQDCLGTASGTPVDLAYGEYGVAAYTLEVGNNFFEPCDDFESTVWPEVREILLYAAKAARRPYLAPAGPDVVELVLSASVVGPGTDVTVTATLDDTRHAPPGPDGESPESVDAILSARLSIDAPPESSPSVLYDLAPVDGAFDEALEVARVVLDTTDLAAGRHLVHVVAEDSSGAVGVSSAAWLEIRESIFADGFESGDPGAWSKFDG